MRAVLRVVDFGNRQPFADDVGIDAVADGNAVDRRSRFQAFVHKPFCRRMGNDHVLGALTKTLVTSTWKISMS